jgi:hypothetical protein
MCCGLGRDVSGSGSVGGQRCNVDGSASNVSDRGGNDCVVVCYGGRWTGSVNNVSGTGGVNGNGCVSGTGNVSGDGCVMVCCGGKCVGESSVIWEVSLVLVVSMVVVLRDNCWREKKVVVRDNCWREKKWSVRQRGFCIRKGWSFRV